MFHGRDDGVFDVLYTPGMLVLIPNVSFEPSTPMGTIESTTNSVREVVRYAMGTALA